MSDAGERFEMGFGIWLCIAIVAVVAMVLYWLITDVVGATLAAAGSAALWVALVIAGACVLFYVTGYLADVIPKRVGAWRGGGDDDG